MRLNIDRLIADVRSLEVQLRALKSEIRTTPLPWARDLWKELRSLKADATLLYAIRSHGRGRLHMKKVIRSHAPLGLPPMATFTLEDQARFIADRWRSYAAEGEAA
jgi:hypothetical protein